MRLIWWLATVLAVGLFSIFLSEHHATDPAHNLSLTISAPIEDVMYDAVHPINNIYESIADHGDLVRENEDLKAQVEALKAQLAQQQNNDSRIQALEDALGIKQTRPDDKLLAANVLAQDPSGQKRMVAIDRGTGDGVTDGMVILSRSGSLIGTVDKAYSDYAWVRLITDPDSAVNAQVETSAAQPGSSNDVLTGPSATPVAGSPTPSPTPAAGLHTTTSVRGVADGDLRQGLILDLLPPDAVIAKGTLVVTSGLGGNFPPGILIGNVKDIQARPQAAFKTAVLEPASQLSSLETVLVLVSFKPANLASP
ncbi:MAG: rod shape-determining protein MreC [Chloroflexota bacterium]